MLSLEKQLLYILMRKPGIAAAELLAIYKKRAYSAQSIRNALTRLKKSKYINRREHGYFLSPAGALFIHAFQDKIQSKTHDWDGSWQLVTYQIPESKRRWRNLLRQELLDLGYGQLFQSVFISPHDQIRTVRQIFAALHVQHYANVFSGRWIYGEIGRRVDEIWDLPGIGAMYQDFISWAGKRQTDWTSEETMDSWDAFFHVLELGERFGAILLKDPVLPVRLLPADWPAEEAWGAYRRLFNALTAYVATDAGALRLIKNEKEVTDSRLDG
jgi:phenylacetic acid degradation operon negative regulatory protein